jgi:hypothetical protein
VFSRLRVGSTWYQVRRQSYRVEEWAFTFERERASVLILEMKWSDESSWKFLRHLKVDENPDHALEKERLNWGLTKPIMKPGVDCSFRVIKVVT